MIVPPELAGEPVPVTCTPCEPPPVRLFSAMPLIAPLAETLWSTKPLLPMATPFKLSAVPVPEVMVLPVPVTPTVPPPVAPKPVPLVVWILRPPPVKSVVEPVLVPPSVTAWLAPV